LSDAIRCIDVDWDTLVSEGLVASTVTHTPATVFWAMPFRLYELALKEVEKIGKAKARSKR
jgi:hypothetical protein